LRPPWSGSRWSDRFRSIFTCPPRRSSKEKFSASAGAAQLAFSIALFTMALATLVYGSLSDRFGRRPVLLCGISLFATGGLVCVLVADMNMLLAGRVVQGAGAGCSLVLARAIARDVYAPDRLVKAIAYLTMAYILGPMLAPPIGGVLVDAFVGASSSS
jgi:DHA1 family bicyclomycin/chloramphenicol resistance-like MFS transporter